MCPEASTLSAYFDGELEGVAFDAIEDHVKACSECRTVIDGFRRLSNTLDYPYVGDVGDISVRSRNHIETRAAMVGRGALWNRSLSIPAPLAVVAAMLFLVLSLGLFLTGQKNGVNLNATVDGQPTEFDEIIAYLESRQVREPVTFLLPENTILRVVSEPAFVRAADFYRATK